MTTTLTHHRYLAEFRALEQSVDGNQPAWLRRLRRDAATRFEALGFPTARRGNEKWKYTNVAPIAQAEFTRAPAAPAPSLAALKRRAPWRPDWTTLVFVDGRFAPGLSTSATNGTGVRAVSLAEALRTDEAILQRHFARHAAYDDDGFTALNTAFLHDGAFVHVAGPDVVHAPVHLLFVASRSRAPQVAYPRVLVVTERNTRLTLVETYASLADTPSFNAAVTEIALGEGSRVDHYKVTLESPQAFHVGVTSADVGRDASFSTTAFARGASLARHDLLMTLTGQGAACSLNGLHLTSGREHIDNHVNIDHAAPHSTSYQYVKGILTGRSHAVYTGRVLIQQHAVKSSARQ
ncbi:MAG: Fe-S cluster assembly protein SufD, partial [SAR202 cluster bacterium]|nr:Fe-S cluster assembly protein SufD [SAR202 cluster bacterium]